MIKKAIVRLTTQFALCVLLGLCAAGCQRDSSADAIANSNIEAKGDASRREAIGAVIRRLVDAKFLEQDGVTPLAMTDLSMYEKGAVKHGIKRLPKANVQCRITTGDGKNFLGYQENGNPVNSEFLKRFKLQCTELLPWTSEVEVQKALNQAQEKLVEDRAASNANFNGGASDSFETGLISWNIEFNEQTKADEFGDPSATAVLNWNW